MLLWLDPKTETVSILASHHLPLFSSDTYLWTWSSDSIIFHQKLTAALDLDVESLYNLNTTNFGVRLCRRHFLMNLIASLCHTTFLFASSTLLSNCLFSLLERPQMYFGKQCMYAILIITISNFLCCRKFYFIEIQLTLTSPRLFDCCATHSYQDKTRIMVGTVSQPKRNIEKVSCRKGWNCNNSQRIRKNNGEVLKTDIQKTIS